MNINTRFSNAISDVVTETRERNWRQVIEAVEEIAGMVKSSGLGPRGYQAIMQNLEIRMRKVLGQDSFEEYVQVIKHREHYKNHNLILLPTMRHQPIQQRNEQPRSVGRRNQGNE